MVRLVRRAPSGMVANTWVKVVGFSDVERHSINTMLRLSERMVPTYALWTPDVPAQPHIALIDLDSYEGGLEVASPRFNKNIKFICVGNQSPAQAWRTFERPVDWNALVTELDTLFAVPVKVDIDVSSGDAVEKTKPPGVKVSLLVGLSREDRMYLRARLSLAGFTDVDEVQTGGQASEYLTRREYELVVVSLELIDADPWELIRALKELPHPVRSVIVVTDAPSWRAMESADALGCAGLLEIPFEPQQVFELLQRV